MELRLKQIREDRNISQKEMAKRLSDVMGKEIKVRTYGSWERQEVGIDLEQAYYCAIVLGCTPNELVGLEPVKSGSYPDFRQTALNGHYESLNESSKTALVDFAKSYAADPERRIVKERQVSGNQAAMGA